MTDAVWTQVTLEDVQADPGVVAYMHMGDEYLGALGYTEHGQRHANLAAHIAGNVLRMLGYDERTCELGSIAGYMHDIGNCIGREAHGVSAALLAKEGFTSSQEIIEGPRGFAEVLSAESRPAQALGSGRGIRGERHRLQVPRVLL